MRKWYLLQTKPRLEKTAEMNLSAQDFNVFMPTIIRHRLKKESWTKLTEPLFPNYLFVHLDLKLDNWSTIRNTKGVSKLVSFGNSPAIVPVSVIDKIKMIDNHEVHQPGVTFPEVGDAIKVLVGDQILNGILGLEDANQRVWVLLNLLGREQNILVNKNQIRP